MSSPSFSSLKVIPLDDYNDQFDDTQSHMAVDGGEEKNDTNVLEEVDTWLPITESRKGNAYTATFHVLCSGIGTPALVLPFAFTSLGWTWGIVVLTVIFAWRLYTMWLLIHLHESVNGTRYSRYLQLSIAAFVLGVAYFTLLWALSIGKGRPSGVSHSPADNVTTTMARFRAVLNGVAIIAIAFRGHNVVLEIQGTLPTNPKHPTRTSMWRGVIASYSFVAVCIFPLAIGGYWAYGNLMPANGIMAAIAKYHQASTPKWLTGTIYMMVVIQCICAFQIYAMPVFDNLERIYVSRQHKACPRWLRSCIKLFFGGLTYYISVAFPFLGGLAAFVGGIALPLSLVYPCFMWISIKKPQRNSLMYCLNMFLGCLGILISVVQVAGALWNLVVDKLDANFFSP
ncbi:lysine histidine transporter-like 7 isoform X2 [Lycium ferocissimum]|uniref:lysine histidine transporter-like 7 isoform X2 n=1 Tax=Lycium ferocissimum TaxID=112874 RepID=UPI0028169AB4|nr:lysine histidine transporter-like 7 isoform X2 [Lycium ferocissimum]